MVEQQNLAVADAVTDCSQCAHEFSIGASRVWYHKLCGVSPLPKEPDPKSDDELRFVDTNEAGTKYHTFRQYAFCKNVNFGHCRKFDQKPVAVQV